jgi:membrane protein
MSKAVEEQLDKIPIINLLVRILKKPKLKALKGMSIYDLIEMYILGIVNGALGTRASAIAFSVFLALFPLIIFILTLVPYIIPYVQVGTGDLDAEILVFIESFLPSSTGEYFGDIFLQIKNQKHGGLMSSSFLLSIFLMANGVSAIFSGFETSYHIEFNRSYFKQYLYALMIGLVLSLLLIIGVVVYLYFEYYILTTLTDMINNSSQVIRSSEDLYIISVIKVLFYFVLFYLIVFILYNFGTMETRSVKFFSIGAAMTSILFILTSYFFGFYIDNFSRYNELYGALGGLLILMLYIWLNSIILLLGFELNVSVSSLKKTSESNQEQA